MRTAEFTTNSIRARPTPAAGSRHQRIAAAGLARFSMTPVRVSGHGEVERLDLDGRLAGIDDAFLAASQQSTVTSCSSWRRWVALPVPTMAGQPELARHDGRV
jgi:hypothetical protein